MKLKAIHLLNRMERIERDLDEIRTLRSTLQEDREYSSRLRESLQEETLRLKQLQNTLLSQVVHNPPEDLVREISGSAKTAPAPRRGAVATAAPGREPEIILPSGGAKQRSSASIETPPPAAAEKAPEKPRRPIPVKASANSAEASTHSGAPKTTAKAAPAKTKDADEDFPFTFDQG